jgi:hypothetical protein
MRRDAPPRSRQPDLLVRAPWRADRPDAGDPFAPDPVAALAELADLLARGLIARRDLEAQVAKVLGGTAPPAVAAPVGRATTAPSCAGRRPPPPRATRRRACGRSSSDGT